MRLVDKKLAYWNPAFEKILSQREESLEDPQTRKLHLEAELNIIGKLTDD